MHSYFIAYSALMDNNVNANGNTQIDLEQPIFTIEHIRSLERSVINNHNTVTVPNSDKVLPKMIRCTINFYKAF